MHRTFLVVGLLLASSGCAASRGVIPVGNLGSTELDSNDFKVVGAELSGEAKCLYLFGIIPLGNPAVATEAMNQVVTSAKLSDKPIALTNFSGDEVVANYFFIIQARSVHLRATAVEFTK
jgi:hypothetical protein